jgi:hypothetical protein
MRRRKKNVVKGPMFPSFLHQQAGGTDGALMEAGVQSLRQRMKNLTLRCRPIIDSRDPETVRVGRLVIEACQREPNPKLASLVLINAAIEAADSTGEPWPVCASVIVSNFLDARVQRIKALTADQPVATATTDAIVSPPAERI